MKIDANGTVRESRASGDFRTGHALDETEDESFAIRLGKGEDGFESRMGFGGGVWCWRGGKHRRICIGRCGVIGEFVMGLGATMKIGGAVAGDGREPAREFGNFAERGEARESLQENVLEKIVDVGVGNAGQKDAVNHTGVARVEKAEGGAIAVLGGADERVFGSVGERRGVHGKAAGEWST
jgi:hypothetical protein